MTTFPPIAEYGFLSDCENSCLVAPDGSVEWLCLPRPDSPSVFGALLDRSAGFFQFGPTKTRVPHQRRYTPGTMVMETTWHTPTGWLVVEDLLVIRPVGEDGRRQDYRRAPTDAAAVGTLLRTATCIGGRVEIAAACLPLFEYGLNVGSWSYQGDGYHSMVVRPPDDKLSLTLTSSLKLGATGARCYGRTTLEDGESCYVALSWNGSAPTSFEDDIGRRRLDGRVLAQLAGHGHLPGSSLEALPRAQRADVEGTQLRPDRRHHGGVDDLSPGNPGRGTQLGLPLHLDQGFGLHAPLALPAGLLLGGGGVFRLRDRGDQRRGPEPSIPAADHVRHRR